MKKKPIDYNLLVYLFCNGFTPSPDFCNKILWHWLNTTFKDNKTEMEKVINSLPQSNKYTFQVNETPAEEWKNYAKVIEMRIVEQHHGRKVSGAFFDDEEEQKGSLLVVFLNADESDVEKAEEIIEKNLIG